MDDFYTLLSDSMLCLGYVKFPIFYLFLSSIFVSSYFPMLFNQLQGGGMSSSSTQGV